CQRRRRPPRGHPAAPARSGSQRVRARSGQTPSTATDGESRTMIVRRTILTGVVLSTLSGSWGTACAEPQTPTPAPVPGAYEPIGHEWRHKLSVQAGYGPEDSAIGNDRDDFHSITYEPTFTWYSPEKRWSRWMIFARANLTYDSGNATNSLASDDFDYVDTERPEYFYAEAREFYVQRNLLGDDPRFSLSLGRQAFSDRYGLFWDDSIESLRLKYDDSFSRGF